jgi:uncharacterized caspase-like protein
MVGINKYSDNSIRSLNYSIGDIESLHELLYGAHSAESQENLVALMTDNANGQLTPTRNNIMATVNSVSQMAEKGDIIIFVFSGHGTEEDGKSYLLPSDARIGILEETAIPLKWLKEQLRESQARAKVLILDACHSGIRIDKSDEGRMTKQFEQEVLESAEGFATLSSCKLNEVSYEYPDKRHGVFSYYLVEGLRGNADTNRDGCITVSDASAYVSSEVKKWAFRNNLQQSPTLEYRVSGDIIHLVELYKDSGAILAHLNNVGPTLQKLLETSKVTRFEVFGNANAEVEKALASFGTKFFKYWDGFLR